MAIVCQRCEQEHTERIRENHVDGQKLIGLGRLKGVNPRCWKCGCERVEWLNAYRSDPAYPPADGFFGPIPYSVAFHDELLLMSLGDVITEGLHTMCDNCASYYDQQGTLTVVRCNHPPELPSPGPPA